MHVGTPSCVLAFGLALMPTFMPSKPSGRSWQGGLRTRVWRRRRRMATHESTRPFVTSVLMGCWILMWTRVRPRMIATPAKKRRPDSVQLSSMPEMTSTS